MPRPSSVGQLKHVCASQSYTGSRDMWGLHDADEDKRRGQSVPIYDDGKIEVIGLESAGKAIAQPSHLQGAFGVMLHSINVFHHLHPRSRVTVCACREHFHGADQLVEAHTRQAVGAGLRVPDGAHQTRCSCTCCCSLPMHQRLITSPQFPFDSYQDCELRAKHCHCLPAALCLLHHHRHQAMLHSGAYPGLRGVLQAAATPQRTCGWTASRGSRSCPTRRTPTRCGCTSSWRPRRAACWSTGRACRSRCARTA
jgi:hypothetical protein